MTEALLAAVNYFDFNHVLATWKPNYCLSDLVLLLASGSPFNINLSVQVPSTVWYRGGRNFLNVWVWNNKIQSTLRNLSSWVNWFFTKGSYDVKHMQVIFNCIIFAVDQKASTKQAPLGAQRPVPAAKGTGVAFCFQGTRWWSSV